MTKHLVIFRKLPEPSLFDLNFSKEGEGYIDRTSSGSKRTEKSMKLIRGLVLVIHVIVPRSDH